MPRGSSFFPKRNNFIFGCAILSSLVGAVVLAGWYADATFLRTLAPGLLEMKPNVAVSFILIGLSIFVLPRDDAAEYRGAYLSACCGAVVLLIGCGTLAQWIFGLNFGIDGLFVKLEPNGWTGQYAGRMPPQSALTLTMVGASVLMTAFRAGGRAPELLLNFTRIIVVIAMLGMLYGVDRFFGLQGTTFHNKMPLITAVMLGVVTTALGLADKGSRLSMLVYSRGAGGSMGRRIVPVVLVTPPLIGLFLQIATDAGVMELDLRLTLTIALSMVVMSLIVFRFADNIGAIDLERQRAESELRANEERYRGMFDYSQGMICIHNIHGDLQTVNRAVTAATGYTKEELTGRNIAEFLPESARPKISGFLRQIEHEGLSSGLLPIEAKDGRQLVWRYQSVTVYEEGAEPYVIGHALDVTELIAAQDELRNLSLTDELTGLLNRRGFITLAEQQLRLERHSGTARGLNLLFADMDGLKKINDTVGHEAGSEAIATLAGVIKSVVRSGDLVARWGGDEFVLLTIGAHDENVDTIIKRIEQQLDEHNSTNSKPYKVACSIGKAPVKLDGDKTFEQIIAEADEAMYRAKRRRKESRVEPPQQTSELLPMPDNLAWY